MYKDKAKRQKEHIKLCCKDNLKKYSCGCSWGCDMCGYIELCDAISADVDTRAEARKTDKDYTE